MAEAGFNMVVIDLGDGVHWQSHPEIAVQGAWTTGELKAELDKMRALGLEPIPKLNFATAHDAWLKEYSRMVSTPVYYQVCADLIAEASVLFDTPRLFHLGMDEETAENQKLYNMCIVRQHELYWHDFHFLVEQVEKAKVRPWIWSDYVWNQPEAFWKNMPKSVLQSNWYYELEFERHFPDDAPGWQRAAKYYRQLEEHGCDQIPTASNWSSPLNFGMTVEHCRQVIAPERLKGFLMAPWKPTIEAERAHHEAAIAQVAQARKLCV
jgi:hypothetical protein